jgi:anti-sigma factor RsiW
MTNLSPAAQAVLDAWVAAKQAQDRTAGRYQALAAALRALDEQLGHKVLDVRCVDCSQIRLIAAELDGGVR